VGVQNSRSPDDELMLRLIGDHLFDPKDGKTNLIQPIALFIMARLIALSTTLEVSKLPLGIKSQAKGMKPQISTLIAKSSFLAFQISTLSGNHT
jgi:hypothetical protein